MKTLSSLCLFLLAAASFSALSQVPATRGLESSGLDQYVSILRSGDLKGAANWLNQAGYRELGRFVEGQADQDAKTVALSLANRIFIEQQSQRSNRYAFVLLQTLLEETVMYAGVQTAMFTGEAQLTPAEWARAGRIRGVRVLPGDALVQIGGGTLSSQFIAHSQSQPGIASHSLLVSKGGDKPEILEALIEDGTNRRDPYSGPLARFFVLSARTEQDRSRVSEATERFISDMKIPFIAEGQASESSPLLYDSTMNPARKKDGYYFCTAVVQEVYSRSGIAANPFPESKANWNTLAEGSVEQGLYRELNITEGRVPAPGDALLNGDMAIRALVLDTAALKTARRLRAMIDGFFDLLYARPDLRQELLVLFRRIPSMEVRKREILAAFDRLVNSEDLARTVGSIGIRSLRGTRAQLEQSLPQTANLRQLAFFMIMNNVIQDRALIALENYETQQLKRHALPGELRAVAAQMLGSEMSKLRAALALIAQK